MALDNAYLLSQLMERSQMQSVDIFDLQSRNNVFSNTYNSDWSDHSTSMWWEPQNVQQERYWEPPHIQYAQPNSNSSIDYNQILNELNSLVQGSQNQAKETHQETYWQPYEDSYAPPQPSPQSSHPNSGISNYYKEVIQQLNSVEQGREAQPFQQDAFWRPIEDFYQAKKLAEWNSQFRQNAECMEQIQEQMVEDEPMDELLLLEEEEDAQGTAREEQPLPQPPNIPTPPHSSKVVPNLIISNFVPPNAPFPGRFMQSMKDEGKKDILDTFPTIHEEKVVEEHLEFIKEEIGVDHTATTFKMSNLNENIPCAFVECAATLEPILQPIGKPPTQIPIPTSINRVLHSSLQAPTQIQFGERVYMDLRTDLYSTPYKDPILECFEKHFVEDVLKFLLEHVGKPPTQNPKSFLTNMLLMSMIRAPTLEIQPLPEHFKYHHPFNDQLHAVGSIKA